MDRKINFTKKGIQALEKPADGKQVYYRDTQTAGLALSVARGGTKSFVYYRKVNGKPTKKFIGAFPDMAIERAREKATEWNAAIAVGENPFDELPDQEQLTLGNLFEQYIERHAKKNRKTWQVMEKDFVRVLNHWRNRQPNTITVADVEKLHHDLKDSRGSTRANRTLQLLRAIYNKAILWKLYQGDNPVKGITLYPETARERFLSGAEVGRLFQALKEEPNDLIKDFVWLSLLTGARKANICSMRWDQIDFSQDTWTIPETKNGTSQTIKLTQIETEILKKRRKQVDQELSKRQRETKDDYVFPGDGSTGHLVDPKKSFARLLEAAKINGCTIHDLRRNLGSWMASADVNVALIKGALHHKDMKTTLNVYARTAKDAEREGREKAHEAMFEAAKLGLLMPQGLPDADAGKGSQAISDTTNSKSP